MARTRRYDPASRLNSMPTFPDSADERTRNLGAGQIKGKVVGYQAYKKIAEDIPQSSIVGLAAALAAKENIANKGVTSGYAPLNASAQVPVANLPVGSGATQVAAGNHTHTLTFTLPVFTVSGALTVATGVFRLPIDGTYTLVGTRLMVNTAPVGADIIVDVNKNGTTIYTTAANRPRILDGANAGGPGSTPDITSLAAGDYLTVDVDQIGSGTAGSNLVVGVIVNKAI